MLRPARLSPGDVVRVGGFGLRSRPVRVLLSALGIAIGIAAMVAVVGISSSSRAELDRTLERLGTNLLTASPGQSLDGSQAKLPQEATRVASGMAGVESATAVGVVDDVQTYRTDKIPKAQSGGITAAAAHQGLLQTVGATLSKGDWLNAATGKYPVTVLGATTAELLGITEPGPDTRVWLGGQWFTVAGILEPVPLAAELDTSALVGWDAAEKYLDFDGHPTTVYTRADEERIADVRHLLGRTVNPAEPTTVSVSRPSDALAAKEAGDAAFTGLLLGLGGVALLVGGIGVANTMVISVLERRGEIGLRRSLGATRWQVCQQFLTESLLLSALGGGAGVVIGSAVTAAYATTQNWPVVVPPWVMGGGVGATLAIGGLAGLYPAVRAARLAPTVALAAP
ncbi:ABC transporter permease [Streptomyces sp. TRM66268-LWL]|uniref:ABC transporter permease n=1 Tax=Streptomyces polyasparticus TaxID=2767826 RepID=A0ABR7SY57_9ACTN|nr:ABC transporter permease [Streptomyces polyasparticus]MBC9719577.1 ABC transporter permease [Streptomyces polyasparticus]